MSFLPPDAGRGGWMPPFADPDGRTAVLVGVRSIPKKVLTRERVSTFFVFVGRTQSSTFGMR